MATEEKENDALQTISVHITLAGVFSGKLLCVGTVNILSISIYFLPSLFMLYFLSL